MYAVVHEGLRPYIPDDCPRGLTQLIHECLDSDPKLRPTFAEILSRLRRLQDQDVFRPDAELDDSISIDVSDLSLINADV